jgi:hypothetical protein
MGGAEKERALWCLLLALPTNHKTSKSVVVEDLRPDSQLTLDNSSHDNDSRVYEEGLLTTKPETVEFSAWLLLVGFNRR